MSKKDQNNDQGKDSLNDEQDDAVKKEQQPDDQEEQEESAEITEEQVPEDDTESVAEDIIEDEDDEDREYEEEQDQGFDQQPLAATTGDGSGGRGMAGTAMVMSALALAGTGYNWYDARSLKSADQEVSEQSAVDYSAQIESMQQQLDSLAESQQQLNLMAQSAQSETASDADQAEQPAVADQADESASAQAQAESESSTDETAAEATVDTQGQEQPADQATETEQVAVADQADQTETAEAASTEQDPAESQNVVSEDEQAVSETGSEGAATVEQDLAASEAEDASAQDSETPTLAAQTESEADIEAQQPAATSEMPSGEQIKQMAQQEVDAVLADAKKRLGLTEVAQLVSIGEQRLAIAGDVDGAQTALGLAEQRLSVITDSIVDPVRESISSDLAALDSVELVDKNALTQELNNLSAAIDTLALKPITPLAEEQAAEQSETTEGESSAQDSEQTGGDQAAENDSSLSLDGAGQWLKSIGSRVGDTLGEVGSGIAGDLKGMVTIQKTGPLSDVVLPPEQQYFIRENIKLMLGGAQRAVLQSNTEVFQHNLSQANAILNDFFDGDNEDVQSVSNRLSDLAQINLEPELPDISNTSDSLTEIIKQLAAADGSGTDSN